MAAQDLAIEVVTLGESMVAMVPERRGPLAQAVRFARHVAGAESNFAIGLTRLGHRVRWLGRVGQDAFGDVILQTLKSEGVDISWAVRDPDAPTGLMIKERARVGDSRALYYRRGSAAACMDAGGLCPEQFAGAAWLHLTGITPALGPGPARAVARALELARATGLAMSFDPNYRPALWSWSAAAHALRPLADQADVLVFSPEEGALLYGAGGPDLLARRTFAAGRARLVAIKDGARGASLWTRDGDQLAVPAEPVRVRDTTGAGDAFTSGLVAGLLEGLPLDRAGRLAAVCGALACTVAGDWEGAPTRTGLAAFGIY